VQRGIRNSYFGEDNPYVTSTATPRRKKSAVNPADIAAQEQSGLSNADVSSLLRERGYTGVNDLHADPNSIWVWQGDAMKNGRRVRLGVDSRGNLLELEVLPNRARHQAQDSAPARLELGRVCRRQPVAPVGNYLY
jgi:hypothetical protein